MSLAYVSTYLPQHCGIATYTDYLVHGIKTVEPKLKISIIAENEASPVDEENFKVIPCWRRNEDYPEAIFNQTRNFDTVHIQHEYSIYKFDERLPRLLERLKGQVKLVITILIIIMPDFDVISSYIEKDYHNLPTSVRLLLYYAKFEERITEHHLKKMDKNKKSSSQAMPLRITAIFNHFLLATGLTHTKKGTSHRHVI